VMGIRLRAAETRRDDKQNDQVTLHIVVLRTLRSSTDRSRTARAGGLKSV